MTDPTLHPVLDRASDGVRPALSPQHAASAALARAHLVRRRRRAGGVAGAAAVVVTLALLGPPGSNRAEPPVAPSPPAAGVADADVQPVFDRRTAGTLPQRDSVLPATLEPPAAAADVPGLPMDGPARLVLGQGEHRLLLLGADGRWTATRTPSGEVHTTGISDDGTMLASTGPNGLWVVDVRDGEWRELALPVGPVSRWTGLGTRVRWQGDDRVVLASPGGGEVLTVPTAAGAARRTSSYGLRRFIPFDHVPLDADGALVLGADRDGVLLAEVTDGRADRVVPTAALGRLTSVVATDERIASTVAGIPREDRPTDRAGVLVADRGGYDATAYLPIAGTRYQPGVGTDSPGGITTWGWLDGDTVLLGTDPSRIAPWYLVGWDVTSGQVSRVSRVSAADSDATLVAVAGGLLGD